MNIKSLCFVGALFVSIGVSSESNNPTGQAGHCHNCAPDTGHLLACNPFVESDPFVQYNSNQTSQNAPQQNGNFAEYEPDLISVPCANLQNAPAQVSNPNAMPTKEEVANKILGSGATNTNLADQLEATLAQIVADSNIISHITESLNAPVQNINMAEYEPPVINLPVMNVQYDPAHNPDATEAPEQHNNNQQGTQLLSWDQTHNASQANDAIDNLMNDINKMKSSS